jgi:plastocyanin
VADAVVTIVSQDTSSAPTREAPVTRFIDQKNETFIPYVQILRPGDSVVFRNSDNTRHHVYSFAPARQFEFVLTPGQSSDPLTIERSGIIAVGCNIHDRMVTYLYVSSAQWMVRTNVDGVATFTLPPGDFDVRVWHPQLRPGQTEPKQLLHFSDAVASQQLAFTLALLPDPRGSRDRERADYQ